MQWTPSTGGCLMPLHQLQGTSLDEGPKARTMPSVSCPESGQSGYPGQRLSPS
jgi:hypothetical protein